MAVTETDPAEAAAKLAYAIWRGSNQDAEAPPHWVELTGRQKEALIFVARHAAGMKD